MTIHDLPKLETPTCDSRIHEFGPFAPAPTADYWADWHGCHQAFACRACLTAIADRFPRPIPINCGGCEQAFTQLADYLTWRPL
ncbi:hypothetical protein IU443_28630 [Nocardia farcinica]|uniref:Uncharacterized protein n=1 Tax=Nocardia farcinica TaxID=37329 RepID=A0A0H5PA13_NOCFR|nr:hypothetical protein [Nocardia farcinica]SLG33193.1 Uncharacterised protein [Mycobacteroides abscessus subsp. abscessus]AXK88572.1 hypothetical protein DXT66_25775 [Nocardia farcinica]MBF6393899.1 hypothetical protein [Nocardia farcinica]MBF6540740.1 hypothetical protein [Nocardia farcinica]PFW98880.1 hypothetical protein CJ469_05841 [Nocardia farcinica]